MAIQRRARIVDRDGTFGWLRSIKADDPDRPYAVVTLGNGAVVEVPFELLEHHDDGGYALGGRWRDFSIKTEEVASIPVIEERVRVDVRPAPARQLRVKRRVVSERQTVETPVWHEHIEVERVPVDGSFVDRAPKPRREGDVLIIPCVEEVVIVEKRLRVREELRVRVVRERKLHRQTVDVRRHEIEIDESYEEPEPTPLVKGE